MRPKTTLFMLTSLDGKISTGSTSDFDFDRDLKVISGTKDGLHQYYDAEQYTDLWSFNTGVVMDKIGVNTNKQTPNKTKVSFVLLDNKPHINTAGVNYLCDWLHKVVIYTTNNQHPALAVKRDNLTVVIWSNPINFKELFDNLYTQFDISSITIQSGSTLNRELLKQGLIDTVDLFIAPILVGGKDTPSLIGGESLSSIEELQSLKTLELQSLQQIENSYIRVTYQVNN